MKFKLVESQQLNESTYGLDKKYTYYHLLRAALSDRLLFDLLSNKELLPGFTVYSNRRGSGIQQKLGTSTLLHHIGLRHGPLTRVTELENSGKHNKIHAELFEVIKQCLKDHENIFIECYKTYEERYDKANQMFIQCAASGSDDVYIAIGLKFKAYEDFFRDIQHALNSTANLELLKKAVESAIDQFNVGKELTSDTTEGEAKEIIYA